ncbi:hypothetical protein ISCGN_018555 [Ixodes scapularis]
MNQLPYRERIPGDGAGGGTSGRRFGPDPRLRLKAGDEHRDLSQESEALIESAQQCGTAALLMSSVAAEMLLRWALAKVTSFLRLPFLSTRRGLAFAFRIGDRPSEPLLTEHVARRRVDAATPGSGAEPDSSLWLRGFGPDPRLRLKAGDEHRDLSQESEALIESAQQCGTAALLMSSVAAEVLLRWALAKVTSFLRLPFLSTRRGLAFAFRIGDRPSEPLLTEHVARRRVDAATPGSGAEPDSSLWLRGLGVSARAGSVIGGLGEDRDRTASGAGGQAGLRPRLSPPGAPALSADQTPPPPGRSRC